MLNTKILCRSLISNIAGNLHFDKRGENQCRSYDYTDVLRTDICPVRTVQDNITNNPSYVRSVSSSFPSFI